MIFDDNEVYYDSTEGGYYVFFHCTHCGNAMESPMDGLRQFKTIECPECGAWLKYQITVEVAETDPPCVLTDSQVRALNILRSSPDPVYPALFARKMWPDSDGHRRAHKVGAKGSSRGAGMAVSAGGYLGKLRAAGLTDWRPARHGFQKFHFVTDYGEKLLDACKGE